MGVQVFWNVRLSFWRVLCLQSFRLIVLPSYSGFSGLKQYYLILKTKASQQLERQETLA